MGLFLSGREIEGGRVVALQTGWSTLGGGASNANDTRLDNLLAAYANCTGTMACRGRVLLPCYLEPTAGLVRPDPTRPDPQPTLHSDQASRRAHPDLIVN